MTEKTVFVVTSGVYSDYKMEAVFDDRALAEQYLERFVSDPDKEIVEMALNPLEKVIRAGHSPFRMYMFRDGVTEHFELLDEPKGPYLTRWRSPLGPGIVAVLSATICAETREHAVKILNEHRARLIASGEWDRYAAELAEKEAARLQEPAR